MSKRKTFQRIIPYVILVLALLSGALLAGPLLKYVQDELKSLQRTLVETVEKATNGYRLRYERLSPSLLTRLEVESLRLERPDGSLLFSAERVRLDYNLIELLFGDRIKALGRVEMQGGRLLLDMARDGDKLGLNAPPAADGSAPDIPAQIQVVMDNLGRTVPIGMALAFNDTRVTLTGPGLDVSFQAPSARFNAYSDRMEMGLSLQASTDAMPFRSLGGHFEGTLDVAGQYFRLSRSLQTRAVLGSLVTPWGTLAPQQLEISLSDEEIRLDRIIDSQPIDLKLRWNLPGQTLEADIAAQELDIGSLFTPRRSLGEWETVLLAARYSAQAHAIFRLADSSYEYSGRVSGRGTWKTPDDAAFAVEVRGDSGRLPAGTLRFALPGISLDFATTKPSTAHRVGGRLALEAGAPWLPTPVRLATELDAIDGSSNLHVEMGQASAVLGGYAAEGRNLILDYRNGRLDFRADCRPGVFSGEAPAIRLEGSWAPDGSRVDVGVERLRAADATGLIRPLALLLAGADPGDIDLTFLPEDLELSGTAAVSTAGGTDLRINGLDIRTAAFETDGRTTSVFGGDLRFDGTTFRLESGKISLPQARIAVAGSLNLTPDGGQKAELDIALDSQPAWHFSGSRSSAGQFDLQGPFGLFASGSAGPAGLSATASFTNYPMPFLGVQAAASASLSGELSADGAWKVRVQRLDLTSLAINPVAPRKLGRLQVGGAVVTAQGADIGSLTYQDVNSTLSGSAKLAWDLADMPTCDLFLNLRGAVLQGGLLVNPSPEQLGLEGHWRGQDLSFKLNWTDAPLTRFVDETVKGFYDLVLDGKMGADDPLGSLDLDGSLKLGRAFINKDPLVLSAGFTYRRQVLSVQELRAQFLEHRLALERCEADLGIGSLSLAARYDRPKDAAFVPVLADAEARWKPAGDLVSSLFSARSGGSVDIRNLPGIDKGLHDYRLELQGSDDAIAINETGVRILHGRIQRDGSFLGSIQAPFPLTATFSGQLKGGSIQANLSNISLEIASFAPFLDLGVFKLTQGSLSGSLRVTGDINDPDFYGSLRGSGIKGNLFVVPEELTAARGVLVFEQKKVRFLPMAVTAGKASARVEGGIVISRYNVESVSVDAEVAADGPGVHVKGDFPMVTVDGEGKGKLSVAWMGNTLKVLGQVTAENCAVQLAMFKLPETSPPPAQSPPPAEAEPMYYDVAIGIASGKGVDFYLPNKQWPIIRTYVDQGQTMTVNYNSAQDAWNLRGDLNARGGQIVWAKRNFQIREAVLHFNENQSSFDPRISGKAEGRVPFQDKIIKFNLTYDNNSLANLLPKVSADVPLTNDQVISLLSGNIFNADSSSQYGVNNAYNLFSTLGGMGTQLFLSGQFDQLRAAMGLDLLSVRSDIATNYLVQALFAAAPLDNQSLSPGDLLTVQVGWFIGNDIYIEPSFRLTQTTGVGQIDTSSAAGFWNSIGRASGIGAELELNMDWSLPYFDLNWNWAPKDLTVDRMLKDNTFTFSWRLQ